MYPITNQLPPNEQEPINKKISSVEAKKVPFGTYVNWANNFSIEPIKDWKIAEGGSFVRFSAPDSDSADMFINVIHGEPIVVSSSSISEGYVLHLIEQSISGQTIFKNIQRYSDGYKASFEIGYMVENSTNYEYVPMQEELIIYALDTGERYEIGLRDKLDKFGSHLSSFRKSLDTFHIGPVEVTKESFAQPDQISEQKGGGCLIATAAFGSELAPQIQQLRETRDRMLSHTQSGSTFMTAFNQFYYSFSPIVADWERQNSIFKEAVKVTITPLITTLSILNYVNIHSEVEMLFYGIGIIFLNIGMYFVAPAIVIIRLKQH